MQAILRFIFGKRVESDMTEGNILRHLVRFALPLLLGNVFQQLYNLVDAWVVGNFVSNEAFSAVGTVGPIINLLIGFFMGLSSGAGVVISQFFGAKKEKEVHDTVHTALMLTLLLGIVFTAVGLLITPWMLQLMKTPAEVLPESTRYLSIYFWGVSGLMLYNIGAAILRAVGNSRLPFLFLVVSTLLNIGLDLLFVLGFDMGVEGVALATVLAQAVSAVLVLLTLVRLSSSVRIRIRELRIHWGMLKKIIRVGIPAALQMSVTAFSNVFVQSYINFFGADCMSGWTAYAKIDQLLFLPMQSIALASTTFVGQNLGLMQVDRAKQGVRTAVTVALVSTVALAIPVIAFAPSLVRIFNDKPEVVDYGTQFLRWITPFYVLSCFNQIYAGALRGSGNTRAPMLIMLGSFVLFRQIYLFVVTRYVANTVFLVAMGYPMGWLLCSLLTVLYYRKTSLTLHRVVE